MYTTSKTRLKNAVYSERENYKLRDQIYKKQNQLKQNYVTGLIQNP
ncbi:hypothetical protein pb186bvf_001863 [Paramecium bursaria]